MRRNINKSQLTQNSTQMLELADKNIKKLL